MKILILNDLATTPTYGVANHALLIQRLLNQKGHEARLLATSAWTGVKGDFAGDYRCYGTVSHLQTIVQTANPSAFRRLRRVLREYRPDVVHLMLFLSQLSPLILPLLKDVPTLYHVTDSRTVCPMGKKILPNGVRCDVSAGQACYRQGCLPLRSMPPQMLELWLWQRWRKAIDLILANSYALREQLAAEGFEPVEVLWNAVACRPQRPPLSEPPTAVFAGRLIHEKGADVLMRAFGKILSQTGSARLIIAGDGLERKSLEKLIGGLGLGEHVTMTGYLPGPELDRLFNSAWVQVVPTRCFEGFGGVAAEAMMRGTAVVASAAGGLAEIVQDGLTGMLVPPGDEDALTDAVSSLLNDRAKAEKMGQAGREFALPHFNEERFINKLMELYQLIVDKHSRVDSQK